MAIATGRETTENVFKNYIGIAPVTVLGVNPSLEELKKLYNNENLTKEPEYVSEVESGEDKHIVKNVRIDFIVKTVADKCNGIDLTSKVSIYLRNESMSNKDMTKFKIVDKYGRFGWATKEEIVAKSIPQYKNGPANIDADYRQAFVGEEELTNFIRDYLNIPSPTNYVNNEWVPNTKYKPEECECRLTEIGKYFNNDFKELEEIVKLQPNNRIKVMFGVNTRDGKQYQTAYSQMFLKSNTTTYTKISDDLQRRKAKGSYATTEFAACPIKEYVVEATDFAQEPDPLAPEAPSPWS